MRVGLVAPVASAALGASAEDMSAEEDISLSLSSVCEKGRRWLQADASVVWRDSRAREAMIRSGECSAVFEFSELVH